jgi:aryl-alcohol dehydrogenase-like predicted oxidoreductase
VDQRAIGSLQASVIGLGTNQFGTRFCDERTSVQVINEAIDAGISYIDTADEYGGNYFDASDTEGWGRSEEIIGTVLKTRRDEVVVATKFGIRPHGGSGGGASAAWVRQAAEDSLRRLDTDRIDLYQLHVPDPDVPIAETMGAMADLVTAGKVREIGCCNLTASQLEEADAVDADARFVSLQSALNLFSRGALTDLLPTCERLGLAFVPYYPLASGMLTGKYRRGEVPSDSRLAEQLDDTGRERLLTDRTFDRIEALDAWATARGHSLLELAFAWLLAQPTVATVIAGSARPGQASTNAAAGTWRLSPEEAAEVTRVVAEAAPPARTA